MQNTRKPASPLTVLELQTLHDAAMSNEDAWNRMFAATCLEAVSGYLRRIFAGRSSETLHNRASPVLRYIAWHTRKGTRAFPLNESEVYAFCVEREQKVANVPEKFH